MKGVAWVIAPTCLLRLFRWVWLIYPHTARLGAIDPATASNHRPERVMEMQLFVILWQLSQRSPRQASLCFGFHHLFLIPQHQIITFLSLLVKYYVIWKAEGRNINECMDLVKHQFEKILKGRIKSPTISCVTWQSNRKLISSCIVMLSEFCEFPYSWRLNVIKGEKRSKFIPRDNLNL